MSPVKPPEGLSESWGTDSGLPDDIDFYFDECWFGKNPNATGDNKDRTSFAIRGEASRDGEMVEEELTIFYSLGDGWTATGGGTKVGHANGKTRFMDSSNMGRLIQAIVGLPDALEVLRERGGETFEVETWQGLGFHLEREDRKWTDKSGTERTTSTLLPTGFLGVREDGGAKKAGGATKKAAAKPAAATKKATGAAKKPPVKKKVANDLRDDIVAYAKEYAEDDYETFSEAVFDPEYFPRANELNEDEDLTNELLDPDNEIWTEAHTE